MKFVPTQFFELPRQEKNGLIAADRQTISEFWEEVDQKYEGDISSSIGCYIFSIRTGGGTLPWYVGLAEKQSFKKECLTPHKLNHYNNAIANRKGTPLLTFIPKLTPTNKLIQPTGGEHKDIQFVESFLITSCLNKNNDLSNIRDTKMLRELCLYGAINTPQGKQSNAILEFKNLLK